MSFQMRRYTCALALAAVCVGGSHLLAQAPAAPADGLRFEVASIRPTPDGPPEPGQAGVHISQQQVRFSYLALRDYINIAYKVPIQQIDGPEWINSARFDVAATFPPGATPENFPQLIENLLRDRFRLKARRESRETPILALEVATGGLKIKAMPEEALKEGPFSVTSSGDANGVAADLGQGASLLFTNSAFEARKVTMTMLTETLSRFFDRPIQDHTKVEGRFDIVFAMKPEEYMPMMVRAAVNGGIPMPPQALAMLDGASTGSVHDGLKALGLTLESRKAPVDFLVVESIDKMPTEN